MITRILFIAVDVAAIVAILLTLRSINRMKEEFSKSLSQAMISAISAILANILIAVSFGALFAEISYTLYFASINWIILFLTGFCLIYTEHVGVRKKLAWPAVAIMAADTASMFLNLIFHHVFVMDETEFGGMNFYMPQFKAPYYVHLAIDYLFLAVVLTSFVVRIFKAYSMYRIKYAIILGVVVLVIMLNIGYMAFNLKFDASVVFYAVAGTLISFSIRVFVPRRLMTASIGRAIDDMNEGLILFDLAENCIYANAYAKKRFEIDEETYGFANEPVATVAAELKKSGAIYGKHTYVREQQDDGRAPEHYNIRYNRLADKKGHTIGSYFLIEDITEQIKNMEEINSAKNEADFANRAKSVFLANMSHEIRTPLNSIIGMNEMILRTTDDPKLTEYASDVRSSGEALLSLINDILDFSKIEAGKMEVNIAEYDTAELFRSCYLNFRQMAEEKGIYFNISCDEDMPKRLTGDARMIRQVVSNIISNAVKYTKQGGIDIRIHSKKMSEVRVFDPENADEIPRQKLVPDNDGDVCMLCFEVSDTGIGIAKEDLGVLFDSFKRLNENENATIQGTGLGLAITKELADLMNGDI
ncbi:MAG: hypothetical protein ILP10_02875, partial [Lachnospiraceae bacterium]|nr:hypothetical protein [Lachnospiraceae bacterium]